MTCSHEPFSDAWYFGPERLGERYQNDENKRVGTGFSGLTFRAVLDGLEKDTAQVRLIPSFCPFSPFLHNPHGQALCYAYVKMQVFDGVDIAITCSAFPVAAFGAAELLGSTHCC